jgi:hypothetical protein
MVIAELDQVASNWQRAGYLRYAFDVWDICRGGNLSAISIHGVCRMEDTYMIKRIHSNCNCNATKGKLVAYARQERVFAKHLFRLSKTLTR